MNKVEFLSVAKSPFAERYDNFIGGKFVAPISGKYFDNASPVTGQVVCKIADGEKYNSLTQPTITSANCKADNFKIKQHKGGSTNPPVHPVHVKVDAHLSNSVEQQWAITKMMRSPDTCPNNDWIEITEETDIPTLQVNIICIVFRRLCGCVLL